MIRRGSVAGAAAGIAVLLAACADTAPPVTAPPVTPVPAAAMVSCPRLTIDPAASLGPAFDEESFLANEAAAIGRAFVASLADLYAGDPGRACTAFTGRGLTTTAALDPRLRAALAGTSVTTSDLAFRHAGEGTYDLRTRPPTVPLDVVFDIPAGSVTTEGAAGKSSTSETAQRVALRVTFAYDGHRWLADDAEPVPPADAAWFGLPTPVPQQPPCGNLRHDGPDAGFDDESGTGLVRTEQRTWCTLGGRGTVLSSDQVELLTRFPCEVGRVADLHVGHPLGHPLDPLVDYEYVRDPRGEALAHGWITEPWRAGVDLPADAADTGWTNGNIDLWISPGEQEAAVYAKVGTGFERWPRGHDVTVTDCN